MLRIQKVWKRPWHHFINSATKHFNAVILSNAKNLAFSCCYEILHSVLDDNYNCRVNNMVLIKIRNRSRYMSIKRSLSLLLTFMLLHTFFAGDSFCAEKNIQWELTAGPGLNIDGIDTNQILIAPGLSLQSHKEWLRYRFEGALELIDNEGQITAIAGVAPFLRFDLLNGKNKPFF
jgi:hypothetical protein